MPVEPKLSSIFQFNGTVQKFWVLKKQLPGASLRQNFFGLYDIVYKLIARMESFKSLSSLTVLKIGRSLVLHNTDALCNPQKTLCNPLQTLCNQQQMLCNPLQILCDPLQTLCNPQQMLCNPLQTLCNPLQTLCNRLQTRNVAHKLYTCFSSQICSNSRTSSSCSTALRVALSLVGRQNMHAQSP